MSTLRYIIGIALLLTGVLPANSQVSNDNEDGVNKIDTRFAEYDYVPGQVLVKFKDSNRVNVRRVQGRFASTSIDKLTSVLQKYGTEEMDQLLPNENPNRRMRKARAFNGEIIQERDLSQLYCLKLSTDHQYEIMQLVDELSSLEEVEYAEPNYYCYIMGDSYIGGSGVSSNPLLSSQWYLSAYGVRELWDQPIVNPERPVIAIIDTGVDTNHPDLKDNCIAGYDFVNSTANVIDDNMHGTHVAGIAAACNNETGIVGANPRALIMPIKVMDKNGRGNLATILQGVNYAVENGAKILNLSLGGYGYSKAAADVYRNASLSAIIVAAAGNDGRCISESHTGFAKHGIKPAPSFPAAYSFVLGVQATDRLTGALASFSNYDDDGPLYSCESSLEEPDGFNYELKAPGTEILSTLPGGRYGELQGTSMAAPLVAGSISALMMVKNYESKELLWAELLHTNNIAGAFYLEELPIELDIVRVLLGERTDFTEETDFDYFSIKEAKAGETVVIYPVIRCTSGEASNIRQILEVDDNEDPDVVQIVTGEADFGWHLDMWGKGVSKNPLVVTFPDDIADGRHVRLKIKVYCDEQNGFKSQTISFLIQNKADGLHGNITSDMTLTPDRVYYVDDNLFVDQGVKLTIEPGTHIEFEERKGLSVSGILEANGTPENPIVFTSHNVGKNWDGIYSGENYHFQSYLYMNSDTTLFSIIPTEETPIKVKEYELNKSLYYNSDIEDRPLDNFFMEIYAEDLDEDDILSKKLQADPFYLTPTILKGLEEWKEYCSHYSTSYSKPKMEVTNRFRFLSRNFQIKLYDRYIDTISYCRFEDVALGNYPPYMKDCIIKKGSFPAQYLPGIRNVLMECPNLSIGGQGKSYIGKKQKYWNYVNNKVPYVKYSDLMVSNYFHNENTSGKDGKKYYLGINVNEPEVDHSDYPSYLGTGREDFIRPYIYEIGNSTGITWGTIDLSNMRTTPVPEAHGIIWKVVVNGKDAQDEYEELAPLGVGKHKFEVYFNRPMNKAVEPTISFGVRDPWTQNAVNEDGSWNEEGTIYTAYKTITGKTKSDGVNRIYVQGAEDNEFFPCPYEMSRFNINIQAAGSMATGFAAEASLGRVNLTWDNTNNDISDAMGYNVYRYSDDKKKTIPGHYENGKWIGARLVPDTIRINEDILGIETSEYTDCDVIPNHTYYYLYKVLSTDLKEYDVSNIVAVTPLTATIGDANGSGDVDVADVVTTVNYVIGMKPNPFIFDAADVNIDKNIDVLDVIGIVQKILNPGSEVRAMAEATATYTIEDGILYVESPICLAGIQIQLSISEELRMKSEEFATADDLNGFEQASVWLSDNDYLFLAYSMNGKTLSPGKHALLHIGDALIASMRLSDANGHNVEVIGDDATKVNRMASDVMSVPGIYDLKGRKLTGDSTLEGKLPKGVYIINGRKVVR